MRPVGRIRPAGHAHSPVAARRKASHGVKSGPVIAAIYG